MLLSVLHRLRDHGNTVVVIEHNLDVIKTADWIVDLGPKAATAAAASSPPARRKTWRKAKGSHTGRYLARFLASRPAQPAKPKAAGKRKAAAMSAFENYSREAQHIEHEIDSPRA
jgi:excinuclease ABC subunit A